MSIMEMANTSSHWDDTLSNMSSCSSSLEESTTSSTYTSTSDEGEDYGVKMEECDLEGVRLLLPQELCEDPAIFKEMFNAGLWKSLSEENKRHLLNFFPSFPQNDMQEKSKTLQKLLSGEAFQFGVNPLTDFHEKLRAGNFSPDIARVRALLKRAQYKDYKQSQRRYYFQLMKNILLSRHRLLSAAASLPPGAPLPRLQPVGPASSSSTSSPIYQKVRHRYFKELESIKQEIGESSQSSEDESFPEGPPPKLNKKQKRQLLQLEQCLSPDMNPVTSTLVPKSTSFDLIRSVNSSCNPFEVTEDSYREMLLAHKRKKMNGVVKTKVPNRSQLKRPSSIDLHAKGGVVVNKKQNVRSSEPRPQKRAHKSKSSLMPVNPKISSLDIENCESEGDENALPSSTLLDIEGDSSSSSYLPGMPKSKSKTKSFTVESTSRDTGGRVTESNIQQSSRLPVGPPPMYPNLGSINMMDLPVDIDESSQIDVEDIKPLPELLKKTHPCYFSLIRDIFCSTWDHRLGLLPLREQLQQWSESSTSLLNSWYSLAKWTELLPSALAFLTGESTDCLPDEFVPYVEYKPACDAYQWIGAGRDSDARLLSLYHFWMERREKSSAQSNNLDVENVKEVKREPSPLPPPARCQTSWVVTPATPEERESFREQERRRFEQPHRAFTYRMHGYEAIVGPVRGMYNAAAGGKSPRGHSLLVHERPNYVTILTLVRDAVARLPNGQGTRADICTLLRDSQYLNTQVKDTDVQNVVSGALDRLHAESDSSVKYDSTRKNWIYLHRARSEADFELVHKEMQGMAKTKGPKKMQRVKKDSAAKEALEGSSTTTVLSSKKADSVADIPSTPASPSMTKPKTIKTLVPNQNAIAAAAAAAASVATAEPTVPSIPAQSRPVTDPKPVLVKRSSVPKKPKLSQGAIMSKLLKEKSLNPVPKPLSKAKLKALEAAAKMETKNFNADDKSVVTEDVKPVKKVKSTFYETIEKSEVTKS